MAKGVRRFVKFVWVGLMVALPALARADDNALAGTFVYVGGEAQRAEQQKAIEAGIDGMFFVAKPIARTKLRERSTVPLRVEFDFTSNEVTTFTTGSAPVTSRSDGAPTPFVTPTGEHVTMRQQVDGNALVQSLMSSQGSRENRYALAADGVTLTLHVTIKSPQLPHAIAYALTYRRQGPAVTASR
jgi:hypothetical protein